MKASSPACPCGGVDYASCCGRYHDGNFAPDALALMRSRYSAYVHKRKEYLLATWHADTRPAALDLALDGTKWIGLEIKAHQLSTADRATVEFIARYKITGRAGQLHEVSCFVHENGQWFYVDAAFPNQEK